MIDLDAEVPLSSIQTTLKLSDEMRRAYAAHVHGTPVPQESPRDALVRNMRGLLGRGHSKEDILRALDEALVSEVMDS